MMATGGVNPYRLKLHAREPLHGIYCFIPAFQTIEVLSHCGLDYLLIDLEHSPSSHTELHLQLATLRGSGMHPVVRTPVLGADAILPYLDLGLQNFVFTGVRTAQGASAAASSTRYPPHGTRGIGARMRAVGYRPDNGYYSRANAGMAVGIQIESREGLANLEQICAVDGVDLITFGPQDFAADCGYLGDPRHADVVAAIRDGIARALACGKAVGMTAFTEADARYYASLGASVLTVGADIQMLASASDSLRKTYKGEQP
jgi:4-hydroxy-2-oxoheptanedioate aldolase